LKEAIKKAMESFKKYHDKQLPEHLIFYRDGVGDGMKKTVIMKEVKQMVEAINETYNKAKTMPFITVIIVNK
jgi:hypothetical protein